MELAETFSKNFDFIRSDVLFLSVKSNCFLDLAFQSFYLNNLTKGDSYIKEFEDLIKTNKDIVPGEVFIEKAYSKGASEYYRKGNFSKSKQLLKSGLLYAPNNFGLQQRLRQFDN